MTSNSLSEIEQECLVMRMVGRNGDIDEPQGADRLLFSSLEAWSTLMALQASEANIQGIIGTSMLQGNAYILILNLYHLLDKNNNSKNSLKNIWKDYKGYINSKEIEEFNRSFQTPGSSLYLKYIYELRNGVFAHNRLTRTSLENEKIEKALHFYFRCWNLLNQLLYNHPILFPYKDFRNEKWKLTLILENTQFLIFEKTWNDCIKQAEVWRNTPIID